MIILHYLLIIFILFLAIILHECAHGWTAYQLGDPTAKEAGRLTLNPLKHIDPFGTIILPAILLVLIFMGHNQFIFGWAKPVPVNFFRLRRPKRDMMLVGVSGPLVNISLALFFSFLLKLKWISSGNEILELAVFINLLLAIFNLVPIPPLDGSRLIMGLLPNRYALAYSRLERYGIFIVIFLLYLGFFQHLVLPIVEVCGKLLGVKLS